MALGTWYYSEGEKRSSFAKLVLTVRSFDGFQVQRRLTWRHSAGRIRRGGVKTSLFKFGVGTWWGMGLSLSPKQREKVKMVERFGSNVIPSGRWRRRRSWRGYGRRDQDPKFGLTHGPTRCGALSANPVCSCKQRFTNKCQTT
jgi:hypothetical protein